MLEYTDDVGRTVTIRASFWQWVKAGVAFTVGAMCVSAAAGVVMLVFYAAFMKAMLIALAR